MTEATESPEPSTTTDLVGDLTRMSKLYRAWRRAQQQTANDPADVEAEDCEYMRLRAKTQGLVTALMTMIANSGILTIDVDFTPQLVKSVNSGSGGSMYMEAGRVETGDGDGSVILQTSDAPGLEMPRCDPTTTMAEMVGWEVGKLWRDRHAESRDVEQLRESWSEIPAGERQDWLELGDLDQGFTLAHRVYFLIHPDHHGYASMAAMFWRQLIPKLSPEGLANNPSFQRMFIISAID